MKSIIKSTNNIELTPIEIDQLYKEHSRCNVEFTIKNITYSDEYEQKYYRGYMLNSEDDTVGVIVDASDEDACRKRYYKIFSHQVVFYQVVFIDKTINNNGSTKYVFAVNYLSKYGVEEIVRRRLERIINKSIKHDDKPDLNCQLNNKDIGIEVMEACIKDAKEIKKQVEKQPTSKEKILNIYGSEVIISAGNNNGIVWTVTVSDLKFVPKSLQNCIDKKDILKYNGFDELWLALYCDSSFIDVDLISEDELRSINMKKFRRVYIISGGENIDGKTHIIELIADTQNKISHIRQNRT